jgi:pimeloyl-ACP methyl ester carboxylesterase
MRLNLAVFSQGRAAAVAEGEPTVQRWVVGGHSLGGAMACRYAANNPGAVDGLLLVGAYCDRPVRELPALAVLGTRDAVLNRDRFAATRDNLPADHGVVRIEGMNHSQAGWYGGQRGGRPARIPTPTAHRRLAAAVDSWLCEALDHCGRDGRR